MRTRLLPIVVPAVLAVMFTSGGLAGSSTDQTEDPAAVLRQLGVPDSIAQQWVEPYIPLWALTQEAPIVGPDGAVSGFRSAASVDCPHSLEIDLFTSSIAIRFDNVREVTELYVRGRRYDIAADLSYTTTTIPSNPGDTKLAVDLDLDGEVDIVSQYWDNLQIHSAPDWTMRADFEWPGLNVTMKPVAVNIDDDPYWEIYVTPHSLGFSARAVIIDYNPMTDTFEKIADIETPYGAAGYPAVGDFDEDGRTEFISWTFGYGYRLYEWQESTLVYIGLVGDSLGRMNYNAVACRPKPGGVLHALLGHSGGVIGYHYQLLEPTGDNTFDVAHVFQGYTGASGIHPCWAADTDCDGLDELATHFYPQDRVWEWDEDSGQFILDCIWSAEDYDGVHNWHTVDLDQNGAPEWGATSTHRDFRAFPDPTCVLCDGDGTCPHYVNCSCVCNGDPLCDGQVDILDVVGAVDVAFRNGEPFPDPSQYCSRERTNVDCNGHTDVLDVVRLVNVAFRNADPAVEFCDPCAP